MKRMRLGLVCLCLFTLGAGASAQDRLKKMPGYEQYQSMRKKLGNAFKSGALNVTWVDDGKAMEFTVDGQRYHYDLATGKKTEAKKNGKGNGPGRFPGRRPPFRGRQPERGRQFTEETSPNKKWQAFYKDHNLWISSIDQKTAALPVTTEGDAAKRLKFGTASWVYGEELYQRHAMWWSPDSKKLAFYRFDESKVLDYYLTLNLTKIQNKLDVEPFSKPGQPNPVVDLLIYDLDTKKTVSVDVRSGKSFSDDVVGHYVYDIRWTPDGKELLFHRTNRWQNIMEICTANPSDGTCRVVVREEWLPSWTENSPTMEFLKDGQRFILASDRTGYRNYYLYNLDGKLLHTLTSHDQDVDRIVRVDEEQGYLYYMAHTGDNHMKMQLHRVSLTGDDDQRITDPALNHSVNLSPDGKYIVDVAQTHDKAPETRLLNSDGKVLDTLATSDLSGFEKLGLQRVELFTFTAGDGKTKLHGMLHKPSNFDPSKKYPLLVGVYAGPNTAAARESFRVPNPLTEYGFLVANIDSRSVSGRGKKIVDSIYQRLGVVEIDDQAEGVKELAKRSYVDGSRVGIYGTSYGGYASIMCLLRHPEVFHAASASSSTTDWRNYDTIYTERYMRTPQANKKGYEESNPMNYINNLKGRLMIFYGTSDNNVYPAHSLQLIAALQKAGKSFEVQVGPDRGHTAINTDRMMEFFIENLVMNKE